MPLNTLELGEAARRAIEKLERTLARKSHEGGFFGVPTGLLTGEGWDARYGTIPPEAFPVLDDGVDGAHYALWLDDPSWDVEPCVVHVAPMDSNDSDTTLGSIHVVAETADDFLTAIGAKGWKRALGPARRLTTSLSLHRDARIKRLMARRRGYATLQTLDGMGVRCRPERDRETPAPGDAPDTRSLRTDGEAARRFLERLVDQGRAATAVTMVRDLLTLGCGTEEWFPALFSSAYAAAGRPLLAEVAARAYLLPPEQRQLLVAFRAGLKSTDVER